MDADVLERTFREMRAADQMREAQKQPNRLQAAVEAAREGVKDPMRGGSLLTEFTYGVEDIRQKVVEAPTYGQEVTPSLHDGRFGDPLMRAYAERREVKAEELYGKTPEQAKEPDRVREDSVHEH